MMLPCAYECCMKDRLEKKRVEEMMIIVEIRESGLTRRCVPRVERWLASEVAS